MVEFSRVTFAPFGGALLRCLRWMSSRGVWSHWHVNSNHISSEGAYIQPKFTANIYHSILAYPVSPEVRFFDAYAASLSLPSESFWMSTAPSPLLDASTCGITCLEGLKYWRHALQLILFPSSWKSLSWLSVHWKRTSFFRNFPRLEVKSDTVVMNWLR